MEPGSILAGRYVVGETLGRGGMGFVVKATHVQLGTPVAIKLLRPEALEEPVLVERFLREARSAARLRGEHVCRVTDFGTTEFGIPFMVMEYLDGDDLATLIDSSGALDAVRTATYILQACIAVAEAHALGIIHRDLKPGNLFLIRSPDGRAAIKLLDFGIAKSAEVNTSLTSTAKAMGSPAYMSPEQLRAQASIDPRSDIWSLGVTMFELLTERRPFDGDTPYELALRISTDPPARLPDTVPAELATIVMRCLDKDRERRYGDVAELAAALAPLVKGGRDLATSVSVALLPASTVQRTARATPDTEPSAQTETTMRGASGAVDSELLLPRSRFVLPLAIAAVGVIALVLVVAWPRDEAVVPAEPQPATAPSMPAPAAIDAPAPDAFVAAQPDAPPEPVIVPVDAAELEPVDAAVERKPKKPKPRKKPRGEPDLGSSRF